MHTATAPAPGAPVNFRDLGGVPVPGGRLRPGLVFRSDDLATAPAGFVRDACARHGIGHVLDLRSAAEAAHTGRGPFADPAVTGRAVAYHHVPLTVDTDPDPLSPPADPREVGVLYADMADRSAPALAVLLTLIAVTDRPAAFHCAAGKDRTGVLAALVLTALGADPGHIADDYARTEDALPALHRRLSASAGAFAGLSPETARRLAESPMARAPRESMLAFLETAADRHGGDPLGGVRAAGLDDSVVHRLRTRLVGEE
ncbi:tyrosine-protein phosphatase [Nocardiopsis sp. CC223A]|uniref:tyrosine-protein phosphatase n=1 Tax=Nocardiopsis sp. CC223A TaxID=3044051 RepID=UPI00278C4ED2|nr:tyrosine-protein phosphatase [Nocardiopsis sp. CC223A]